MAELPRSQHLLILETQMARSQRVCCRRRASTLWWAKGLQAHLQALAASILQVRCHGSGEQLTSLSENHSLTPSWHSSFSWPQKKKPFPCEWGCRKWPGRGHGFFLSSSASGFLPLNLPGIQRNCFPVPSKDAASAVSHADVAQLPGCFLG